MIDMRIRNCSVVAASMMFAILLAAPLAFAQAYPITLNVDPKGGATDNAYTFRVTWDTNVGIPDFTGVSLEYKRGSSDSWNTYSRTEGTPPRLELQTTTTASGVTRLFTLVPSQVPAIPSTSESPLYAENWNFRVKDSHYIDGYSNPVTIGLTNKCSRSAKGSMKVVPGTGYKTSGTKDALVPVEEGDRLGTGTEILYDLSVYNSDIGCGVASMFEIKASGTGVNDLEDQGRFVGDNFRVVSRTNPDGTVNNNPGTVSSIQIDASRPTIFRIEVEADEDIAPGVKAFGVVTLTATNLDAQKEGGIVKVEDSARITVDFVRDCVRNPPKVSVSPTRRDGWPGQQVAYLVTVENNNVGCDPETFTINQVGVQKIDQRNPDGFITDIEDKNSARWAITARHKPGGTGNANDYGFTSSGGTFTRGSTEYARFTPSGRISFTLGNFDESTNKKNIILKVTSSTLESKEVLKTIAVCVDQNNACNTATYNLVSKFTTVKPADTSNAYVDVFLDTPEATAVVSAPRPTPTPTPSPGVPISGPPEGLDKAFFDACKVCTLKSRMGYNTDARRCEVGNPLVSTESDASADNRNWIWVPLEDAKRIIPDSAKRTRSFSCERPPSGVGKVTSSSSQTTTTSTTTSQSTPPCVKCTAENLDKGWNTDGQTCEKGTIAGSSESTASIANKNWAWFSSETTKGVSQSIKSDPSLAGVFSCERLPSGSAGSDTCSAQTACNKCTPDSSGVCGWDITEGKCKKGSLVGSDDGKADNTKGNWVWYTTASSRNSRPGLSCEEV